MRAVRLFQGRDFGVVETKVDRGNRVVQMMRFHGSDDGARDIGPGPADRYAALTFEISSERFEELAEEVLTALPRELAAKIENLAIIIDDTALGENLFGLYEGIALTKRGPNSYGGVMPDRITQYQTTICRRCSNEDEVKARIRKTVIHEVAHHFGISDPQLEELGWA